MAGPTQGATEITSQRWHSKPLAAASVRVAIVLLPFVVAWVAVFLLASHFYRPDGFFGLGLWLAQSLVVSLVVSLSVERLTRQALPLAALLNMTLVFPDQAPSRFSTALKSGTIGKLKRRVEDFESNGLGADSVTASARAVELVSLLSQHDRLTRGHTERVRAYSDLIAEEMGLPQEDRDRLAWGAMLHDIGKLTVPTEILNKNGRPSEAEWQVLQGHPAASSRLLEPLKDWLGEWGLAAAQHHERWDGGGYPAGLSGTDISLAGRIAAVADAYDVMTSRRSYKVPISPEAAKQELIECAGSQFDPEVVRAFLGVSLGRRVVAGPLAWILELPGVVNVGSNLPAATNIVAGAVVAAGSVVVPASLGPSEPSDLAYTEQTTTTIEVVSEAPPTSGGTTLASRVDEPVGTTTSSSIVTAETLVDEDPTTTLTESTTTTTAEPGPQNPQTTATTSVSTTSVGQSASSTTTTATTTTVASTTTTTATTTTTTAATTTTTVTTTTTTTAPTTTTSTIPPGSPTAVADTMTVEHNKDKKINVLDNDLQGNSPLDEDTLVITVDPTHAANFRVHNDHIHYKAEKDFQGTDYLEYEVCNENGLCATGTLTITVTT